MRVVTYPEHAVPLELRLQAVRLQELAWPSASADSAGEADLDPAPWHDPELRPVSVLLLDDADRVLAALDVLSKPIVHRGETFAASGISAMVTDPEVRGLGLGRELARAALELMAASGADLGIFTCDSELEPFYASAGWRCLAGSVLVGGTPDAPFPSDQFDKVTMASFFSPRAVAAAPGFVGARIELYSGAIDRLW